MTAGLAASACASLADDDPETATLGDPGQAITTVSGTRPLVTVLAPIPAPELPEAQQWASTSKIVQASIPDNGEPLISDLSTVTPDDGDGCSRVFGVKVMLATTHRRHADLIVDLSTVSADGTEVYATERLWDGPATQDKLPAGQIAMMPAGGLEGMTIGGLKNYLMGSRACGNWRLSVQDVSAGVQANLSRWTLQRRMGFDAMPPDSYYQELLFGPGPRNIAGYFAEESRHHFTVRNAGIFRAPWMPWNDVDVPDFWAVAIYQEAIRTLERQGFNFPAYDNSPRDGMISQQELAVVASLNYGPMFNQTRDICIPLTKWPNLRFCGRVTIVGAQPDFDSLAHELTHNLGNTNNDLYYPAPFHCHQFSIMSCTSFEANSKYTRYVDPWHRIKFGWYAPHALDVVHVLGDETYRDFYGNPSRPAIIRRPGTNDHEYMLFELRTKKGYDANINTEGVVIWHVEEGANGELLNPPNPGEVLYPIGPGNQRNSSQAWNASHGSFKLQWRDGTELPYTFWIEDSPEGDHVTLRWEQKPSPTVSIVRPANGSSATVGFGSPVTFEASLRDYRGDTSGFTQKWTAQPITSAGENDGSPQFIGTGNPQAYAFTASGRYRVTVLATDRYGGFASASVVVNVSDAAPWARIDAPTANATFTRGQPITLQGAGGTAVVLGLPCNQLTWRIDRLPSWSGTGCSLSQSIPVAGPATVTLTVTELGMTASASVVVNIVEPPPDAPPVVSITQPAPNFRMNANETQAIGGLVQDPRGGAVGYRWTLFNPRFNQELFLSTESAFRWWPFDPVPTSWSGDRVELRLVGTNDRGQTTMATITGIVSFPPR